MIADLLEALNFAADQHKYQRRGGYEPLPYINHLLKVTHTVYKIGQERDRDLLLAAVLHDVVEDTDVSVEDLANKFGAKVADIVAELTDDMNLSYAERKQRQVDRADDLPLAARKIRIADKACNIQDIFTYPLDWSVTQKEDYVTNAVEVVTKIRGSNEALEIFFDEMVAFAKLQLTQQRLK